MFCVGEFNKQSIRLDLNPADMGVDEDGVLNLIGCLAVLSNSLSDNGLDFGRWDPPDGAGLLRPTLNECRREVVAVFDAPPSGMAWGHPMAAIIVDATQQEGF